MTAQEQRFVIAETPIGTHPLSGLCAYWSMLLNRVIAPQEAVDALATPYATDADPGDEDGQ
jgi:hypothetical protein